MPFAIAFQVITVLLVFQLDASLGCVNADWQASFDHPGWSVCPNSNTYLKGLWRHERVAGDERIGRIEFGKCCPASDQDYTNQPATCSNANWVFTLDGFNVWAECPNGFFLNGFRVSNGRFLSNIEEAKCCRPQNQPEDSYEHCYDEDVTHSFDNKGWSECKWYGYYMTGLYKSSCNNLYCIEKFKCCRMKSVDGGWSDWSEYGECKGKKNCGKGKKTRTRTCTNPPPSGGGRDCKGNSKQTKKCNLESCKGY